MPRQGVWFWTELWEGESVWSGGGRRHGWLCGAQRWGRTVMCEKKTCFCHIYGGFSPKGCGIIRNRETQQETQKVGGKEQRTLFLWTIMSQGFPLACFLLQALSNWEERRQKMQRTHKRDLQGRSKDVWAWKKISWGCGQMIWCIQYKTLLPAFWETFRRQGHEIWSVLSSADKATTTKNGMMINFTTLVCFICGLPECQLHRCWGKNNIKNIFFSWDSRETTDSNSNPRFPFRLWLWTKSTKLWGTV